MKITRIAGLVCIGLLVSAFSEYSFDNIGSAQTESPSNFYFEMGSEFQTTITREKLNQAKSVMDIIPEANYWRDKSIKTAELSILKNYFFANLSATSTHLSLNEKQIKILPSAYYSDNLKIIINGEDYNQASIHRAYLVTVVPEMQATYNMGLYNFLVYLKKNTESVVGGIDESKLRAGKISYTITSTGELTNVQLLGSSGYPAIDNRLLELIKTAPGKWTPATDSDGKAVDQTLFFSFGAMGC